MGSRISTAAFALDEDLWFGDGDDEEAESRAAASLAAVGARIVGAKPFPVAARRLDELTRNPNTRIEQVVGVLESDPALSARLLRLVNSAGYALKIRCTSARHAAVLVGSRRLNQLATTAAILDLFDANNDRALELLEHSAVVGSLCRYLAVHVGLPHDEMFTCGFLHDIGKLMLLDAERERYADLLSEFGSAPDRIHLEERRVFGFDHAVLGAHVLAAWNIPDPVPKVIAWHHAPARALQDTVLAAMVHTLRLSDLLAYVLPLQDQSDIERVAASESARYLDISDAQLAAMWKDLSALRERSRARSQGDPELDAILPKGDTHTSLRPKHSQPSRLSMHPQLRDKTTHTPAGRLFHEIPTQFPCSVCRKPSYGNVCGACGGHVCPEHQGPGHEWCSSCRRDFAHFRSATTLGLPAKVVIGALVGGTLAVGVVGALRSAEGGMLGWIAGPSVVVALWAVILPVAYQLWQKLRFLQTRRAAPSADEAGVVRSPPVLLTSLVPESSAQPAPFTEIPVHAAPEPVLSVAPLARPSLSIPSRSPRTLSALSQSRAPSSAAPAPVSVAPVPVSVAPVPVSVAPVPVSVAPVPVSVALPHSQIPIAPLRAPIGDDLPVALPESGPHVVAPRETPAWTRTNSTLRREHAVRCSAVVLNPCLPYPSCAVQGVAEPEPGPQLVLAL